MNVDVNIRPETFDDSVKISEIIESAFQNHPHSNHKEQFIVSQLRDSSALSVSLVAEYDGELVGHIAFSEVKISNRECNWYGLAPVSVIPEYQNFGIGTKLIKSGLDLIKRKGAEGCVLLGDPNYYGRFGFKANPCLVLEGVPPEFFLTLNFGKSMPSGIVEYHKSFAENG